MTGWKFTVAVNSGCDFIDVNTGMKDWDAAWRYVQRLYGDDAILVDQHFDVSVKSTRPGFLNWF